MTAACHGRTRHSRTPSRTSVAEAPHLLHGEVHEPPHLRVLQLPVRQQRAEPDRQADLSVRKVTVSVS